MHPKRKSARLFPRGVYRELLSKLYSSINIQAGAKKNADDIKALKSLALYFVDYIKKLVNRLNLDHSSRETGNDLAKQAIRS